jgi:hypothetical protein
VLKNPAGASADELRAVWEPVRWRGGTFEVSGKAVTMRATVAKNPAAMVNGAASVFTCQRSGDTLTLRQVSTSAGRASNPVTITLARVE